MTKKNDNDEFDGITGWNAEMEAIFQKRLQEMVSDLSSGPMARIVRAAMVNADYRKMLEDDPAGVLADNGISLSGANVVVVSMDRDDFPVLIPRVVRPCAPMSPTTQPVPESGQGPAKGDICDDDLSSGSVALFNDDFDTQGLRNNRGQVKDGNDSRDFGKMSDGSDPTPADPDSRD